MPRRAPFKLVAPRVPEAALHKAIADVFRLEIAPAGRQSPDGVVWWSQDIANYGGTTPGLRTTRGVIAGVPDMIVIWQGHAYFIEIKAADGRVSDAQQELAYAILCCGARWGTAKSVEGALQLMDWWGIPRRRRVRGAA